MFSEPIEYLNQRADRLASDPHAAAFVAHSTAQRSRLDDLRQLAEQIIASNGGTAVGVELAFRCPDKTHYCAILEEPDSSGRGRIVYFDAQALHRHQGHASPAEALEQALAHGYRERADGTMDRLATSEAWRRGLAYSELVARYASGEIDAIQFAAEVRQLG